MLDVCVDFISFCHLPRAGMYPPSTVKWLQIGMILIWIPVGIASYYGSAGNTMTGNAVNDATGYISNMVGRLQSTANFTSYEVQRIHMSYVNTSAVQRFAIVPSVRSVMFIHICFVAFG
jgi:hypothetical protein